MCAITYIVREDVAQWDSALLYRGSSEDRVDVASAASIASLCIRRLTQSELPVATTTIDDQGALSRGLCRRQQPQDAVVSMRMIVHGGIMVTLSVPGVWQWISAWNRMLSMSAWSRVNEACSEEFAQQPGFASRLQSRFCCRTFSTANNKPLKVKIEGDRDTRSPDGVLRARRDVKEEREYVGHCRILESRMCIM